MKKSSHRRWKWWRREYREKFRQNYIREFELMLKRARDWHGRWVAQAEFEFHHNRPMSKAELPQAMITKLRVKRANKEES